MLPTISSAAARASVVGLAAHDLEARADLDGAPEVGGHLLRSRGPVGHELDGLAPHQVDVGVARRSLHRRVGRAAEVDRRMRTLRRTLRDAAVRHAEELAGVLPVALVPRAHHDVEELGGAAVAAVVVDLLPLAVVVADEVAVLRQLVEVAARDDVEQDAAAGERSRGWRPCEPRPVG